MSSSEDAIKRVVAAFEQSDWTEIDVRSGDVRVHLSVGSPVSSPSTPSTPSTPSDPSDEATSLQSTAAPPAGAHVVVSPSPGIFWRSPEPGAPPFADVGHSVDSSATVCIIEVMKLMNHLKAGTSGEVVAVYGTDGVAVRKGEPLFAIAPSGTPS